MKTLIALGAYAVISGLIGLLACSLLVWWAKKPKVAMLAALVFFGGPVMVYGYLEVKASRELAQFQEDVAYVKELCAKYGGDKIYKTVENVEGVFQMKAMNPDQDKQWADQYGMVEPWALAYGAEASGAWLGTRRRGYWFVEQQPGYGQPVGPPYRRMLFTHTAIKPLKPDPDLFTSLDGFGLGREEIKVSTLKSQYGYTTEDLTTPQLRKRWIGGGKLKIVDLQTNELLAERTDYYRATGPQAQMAWAAGTGCPAGPPFLADTGIHGFIMAVLKPPYGRPTEQQLLQLKGE